MKKNNNKEIGIIGLWHLGSVYAACLAQLGFKVKGFDFDKNTINNLKKGLPPIEEPELKTTIKKYLNNKLFFTNNPEEAIKEKKYIFITYDVPVNENDQIDLTVIGGTFTLISKYISPHTTIVISSQVPVGYSRKWLEKIRKKEKSINILYFPENLRLGTAINNFLMPDRIIIGGDEKAVNEFEKDFNAINTNFIKIGLESAEMTKHALNSYLAMMISFSSEMSDLCELLGANMQEVVTALKTEKRVSPYAPINPGLGFAGGTLGRDIRSLQNLAEKKQYKTLLLNSIYQVNKNRIPYLLKKIKTLLPSLQNKKIGILGLTYKPNTNTLRRSMSLELATILKNEGAHVSSFDPMIKDKINDFSFIKIKNSLHDFFQNLDAIILMTEWPEFKNINWKECKKTMKQKIIIDTKNFFDKEELEKNSFKLIYI